MLEHGQLGSADTVCKMSSPDQDIPTTSGNIDAPQSVIPAHVSETWTFPLKPVCLLVLDERVHRISAHYLYPYTHSGWPRLKPELVMIHSPNPDIDMG